MTDRGRARRPGAAGRSGRADLSQALRTVLGTSVGETLDGLLPHDIAARVAGQLASELLDSSYRQGKLDVGRAPLLYIGQPVGDGKSGTHHGFRRMAAKCNQEKFPYTVTNEWVGSELGRLLGLPVPRAALFVDSDRTGWFTSEWMEQIVRDAETGEVPPGGSSGEWWSRLSRPDHARLAHGLVCYDVLIGNNDRRPGNLLLDGNRKVWLYDFGNAFFYRPCRFDPAEDHFYVPGAEEGDEVPSGAERLDAVAQDPRYIFDRRHWYLDLVTDWDQVEFWTERFASLPRYQLDSVLDALPPDLCPPHDSGLLRGFLWRRLQDFAAGVEQCRETLVFSQLPATG